MFVKADFAFLSLKIWDVFVLDWGFTVHAGFLRDSFKTEKGLVCDYGFLVSWWAFTSGFFFAFHVELWDFDWAPLCAFIVVEVVLDWDILGFFLWPVKGGLDDLGCWGFGVQKWRFLWGGFDSVWDTFNFRMRIIMTMMSIPWLRLFRRSSRPRLIPPQRLHFLLLRRVKSMRHTIIPRTRKRIICKFMIIRCQFLLVYSSHIIILRYFMQPNITRMILVQLP